jgi:hypothetical protein
MEKGVEMTPFVFLINYFIERILIAFSDKKDFAIAKKSSPFRPFGKLRGAQLNAPPQSPFRRGGAEDSILLLFHNRLKGNIPFFEVP